jgi:hypothetical protein
MTPSAIFPPKSQDAAWWASDHKRHWRCGVYTINKHIDSKMQKVRGHLPQEDHRAEQHPGLPQRHEREQVPAQG